MNSYAIINNTLSLVSSASTAIQHITNVDENFSETELKLSANEVRDTLARVKSQLTALKILIEEKSVKIKKGKKTIVIKNEVIRFGNSYYKKDATGERTGSPLCNFCWENQNQLINIVSFRNKKEKIMYCPKCKSRYDVHKTINGSPSPKK